MITFCHIMEQLRPKTGNPLEMFFVISLFLLILWLPNVSKKLYHGTGLDKLSEQHKGWIMIVALGERCVISWSSYVLKWEIPWKIYCWFLCILLLLCIYNVSHKSYHVMVSDQLSSKQKGGMVSIAWEMAFLSLL